VQAEACELDRIDQTDEANVGCRSDAWVKCAVHGNWVRRIVEFGVVDIRGRGYIDEISLSEDIFP
jgi:hypothetical protein